MDDNDQSFVRVSIFGQEYTVKAQADSRYIADVAEYVDSFSLIHISDPTRGYAISYAVFC